MSRKILKNIFMVMVIAVFAAGFVIKPLTAYADSTDTGTYVGGSDGGSGWGYGDISRHQSSDETTAADSSNVSENGEKTDSWLLAIPVILLIAGITGGLIHHGRGGRRDTLMGFLGSFDSQYEEYRRYYAYCVEEYLKLERCGTEKKLAGAQAIREDMKDVYNKMMEIKTRRDGITPAGFRTNKKVIRRNVEIMKTLCKSENQYQKRLERYLTVLRELNRGGSAEAKTA